MEYAEFFINGVVFGYSQHHGLVIKKQHIDRAGLFNYDYMLALQVAYEISPLINHLLDQTPLTSQQVQDFTCLEQLHSIVLAPFLAERLKQLASAIPVEPPSPNRQGFVYLVKEVNGPHYKIGRSKNPDNRTATFGVKLPYRIQYECVVKTDDMYELESRLHSQFADKRADGEWFALSAEDVQSIHALIIGGADES